MKTQFTPGTWWKSSFEEDNLKQVCTGSANTNTMEVIALCKPENLSLIASAPDMLNALNILVSRIDQWSKDNPGNNGMYCAMTLEARKVIREATGGNTP